MSLFGNTKYEKGGIIRGTAQVVKGTGKISAGFAKEAYDGRSSGTSTGLKCTGTKDIVSGTKKIFGIKVRK